MIASAVHKMEHSQSRLETTEAEANKTASGKEEDLQDVNAQIQKRERKIEEVQAEIKQLQEKIEQLQARIDAEREKHSPNDETIQELKELRSSYLKQQTTYLTYLNTLLYLFKHVSGKASCKGSPSRFFIGIVIYFVTACFSI